MNDGLRKVEFRGVRLSFGDRVVLDGVNFQVRPGELKMILGASGSGKSTILRLILGLIKPDDGEIFIDEEEISRLTETELMPIRRRISMVFQDGALFDSLTVYDNVAYRPRELGWDEEKIEGRVLRVLDEVNLSDEADAYPDELSGGMRRRVAFARAVVDSPEIILFDEATAGLDPPTAREICQLMIRLRDLEGVSVIFVTHKLNDVRYLSSNYMLTGNGDQAELRAEGESLNLINTKILLLRDGRIAFDGTDEQLWNSDDPYIRNFIRMDDQGMSK
jgi:phospholipid/cholesterol/gamma-HCH transport system ATP-binding protein